MATLKNIGQATTMYCDDYDDYFPFNSAGSNCWANTLLLYSAGKPKAPYILHESQGDVYICSSLSTALLFLASWIFVPLAVPSEPGFIYLIAARLLAFIAFILMNFAFLKGDVSVTAPLIGLKILFVPLSFRILVIKY